MDLISVSAKKSAYDSNSSKYDFSVTINSAKVNQVFLFGVDLWDHDGFILSSPVNFTAYINPNMPSEGEKDDFKTSWCVKGEVFNQVGSKLDGFVAYPSSMDAANLSAISWFAYVIVDGVNLQRLDGIVTPE